MRFRGENLRKAKGLKKFIIFFSFLSFFFYHGISMVIKSG
jgi:hypothetical protein